MHHSSSVPSGLQPERLTALEGGCEQAMHYYVGVAADGGREMGVLWHGQRVMAPLRALLHLSGAEICRQLACDT